MDSHKITVSISDAQIFKSLVEIVGRMIEDERVPKVHKDAIKAWANERERNTPIDIERYICRNIGGE